ncbi:alpha/beta fold hydrolase [Kitasatospora sp. NBC_01302]|uniref:alpha/beta fold hydrolase n=1 Tax=Kitasatospora sp. NBC_01302 TaxID=2903575 RepID=UPI002E0F827D|nr:alpha/beta hydrolase [Kitasatospora sp. NBC_01302]
MAATHLSTDASIVYWDEGAGEPVLLVHASFGADWFAPLAALLPGHRVVRTHRAGYGASRDLSGHLTVADHARHLAEVLHGAGIDRAHVVGHSSGASIALHLAVAYPDLVHSLIALEPAAPPAAGETRNPAIGQAISAAHEGDLERAFDLFLGDVMSPGYRDVLARALGARGLAESVASGRYFFDREIAALVGWDSGTAGVETLEQPVLLVDGGEGERLGSPYRARNRALARRLRNASCLTMAGLSHAMPLEDPAAVAKTVLDFIRLQPIDTR